MMPRAWCSLPALLLCVGCGSGEGDAASKYQPDPPGAWYAGDFHVHCTGASNDTGGDSWPQDIARVARERGLYFVVLTDHSNSTGSDVTTTEEDPALFNQGPEFPYWDTAAELSVPGELLMIDGNELSPIAAGEVPNEPRGHIGCIPPDLDSFDRSGAFVDRPRGEVSGGEALAQAKARGCFAVVNHPYALTWMAYDWTAYDYDGIEIFNGALGYDGFDEGARAAWRCDLLLGRKVIPLGGSDNHRVNTPPPGAAINPALGYPTTAVFASEGTWPSIMEGLVAGRVAIYQGGSRLLIDGYDGSYRRCEDADMRVIRLRGRLDPSADAASLRLSLTTSCHDTRPDYASVPTVDEQLLIERTVEPGASFDEEQSVSAGPGVYAAILEVPGGHYTALSRAIVIE